MKNHYHVLCGLHGCMPSSNEVYTNMQDAKQGLKDAVRQLRESKNRLSGSLKKKYFEVIHKTDSLVDYCKISDCQEKECLEHPDLD